MDVDVRKLMKDAKAKGWSPGSETPVDGQSDNFVNTTLYCSVKHLQYYLMLTVLTQTLFRPVEYMDPLRLTKWQETFILLPLEEDI